MNISLSDNTMSKDEKKVVGQISFILPVTERHDDILEMYQEYKSALCGLNTPFEMIAVDNGSIRIGLSIANIGEYLW